MFDGHGDLGQVLRPGEVAFDSASGSYRVSGGGENMWFEADAFHFVWKRVSGDVTLAADIAFEGAGGNPHRKACLLIRQSLDADAAYADAALHGDGLTSLQYRHARGDRTYEIQSAVTAPQRLRIEKRGKYLSMSVAEAGRPLQPAGGSVPVELTEPYYVGLGVCAHDARAMETATFSNLELRSGSQVAAAETTLLSTLETVAISSKDRRVVRTFTDLIEAPNWTRDGSTLIFNSQGRLHRIPAAGGTAEIIDTGLATRCNNDHGLSPDGTQLVISDHSEERHSLIYVLPLAGGMPRRVTRLGPSYWHGWSPDGRTLAYCADRGGEFDVYTIPVEGGDEVRLTTAAGLDDGPEYSPDGRFIYFNSERTGRMQIWRMRPDGSGQEQVTADEFNNWFPHPSPDGKWLVYLSYGPGVKGHPPEQDVMLRLQSIATGQVEVLARLFGGQGTINVPSWSPDSRRVAFVSYQRLPGAGD